LPYSFCRCGRSPSPYSLSAFRIWIGNASDQHDNSHYSEIYHDAKEKGKKGKGKQKRKKENAQKKMKEEGKQKIERLGGLYCTGSPRGGGGGRVFFFFFFFFFLSDGDSGAPCVMAKDPQVGRGILYCPMVWLLGQLWGV
jgi:hypothetical protein